MTSARMGQAEGVLSQAATRVAGAKADLDRLGATVDQHLDSARAAWSGQGGRAFEALGRAWSERQRVIVGALVQLEGALRSSEKDNSTTDDAQSATFARRRQRLG